MARSIWKGSISFGLLNVPVTVYPGEQRHDISFHLVDSRDHARVRYQRVNEDTGEEVPWREIVKAFEYDDGSYVLMTDDELASVAVEATQTVEIQSFVPRAEIETVYFEKPYFLAPAKRGEKGYVLLREVLELLRYPQELRDANDLGLPTGDLADYKITKKELEMAESLLEAISTSWDPADYQDEYRVKLHEFIESKAQGEDRVPVPDATEAEPTNIVDIMSVLRKSLKAKASPARGKANGATAKKTAAKKTTRKPASKASRTAAPKNRRAAG